VSIHKKRKKWISHYNYKRDLIENFHATRFNISGAETSVVVLDKCNWSTDFKAKQEQLPYQQVAASPSVLRAFTS
jgi:hypothetical protein